GERSSESLMHFS
ncbi:hypothetical protein D046_7244B, partial [Vibrio parahaemolyticus V-223/04]